MRHAFDALRCVLQPFCVQRGKKKKEQKKKKRNTIAKKYADEIDATMMILKLVSKIAWYF